MLRHQNHIALVTAKRWDVDAVFAEMSARNIKLRPQWFKWRCTLSSKSFACGNFSIHQKLATSWRFVWKFFGFHKNALKVHHFVGPALETNSDVGH